MSCLSIGIAGNIAKKDGSELSLSSFVWDASTYAVIISSASRHRCGYSSRDCVIRVFVAAMSRRSVSCHSAVSDADIRHASPYYWRRCGLYCLFLPVHTGEYRSVM